MRKKKLFENPDMEIIFDENNLPLIKLKSEIDLKIDYIKKLNKEIGFGKGFLLGIICSTIFLSILFIIILQVFL